MVVMSALKQDPIAVDPAGLSMSASYKLFIYKALCGWPAFMRSLNMLKSHA